ncbi:tape measure protein [Cohnella nanjingensis]|uniref:Tape measure protein n=1 Tax=Cohnella nanjingensis TaxID=1387779 RepID=A0A7X0VEH4_9BACL|nr:tape measure protein [Cohnella nanjingensis]MBB6670283.1 tape measure protein [Cohnella nanjingensis]
MATVSSTLKLFDSMTGPLKSITQGMNIMISTMRQMESVTSKNVNVDKALLAAQQRIAQAETEINRQINQSKNSQDRFNESVKRGETNLRSAGAAVIVINQGIELLKRGWDSLSGFMKMADEVLATNSRLSLVNDGLRTQEKFQQQVLDVANETRASYMATADLITKIGAGTQGVFKNDDQMLRFAEQFNKTLVLSGTSAWEAENAILQMSQALGSGVLQGDELRSLSETAPALMRILADGLGVARGELKKMGADGKLTSDKIVKAFANQSDQINKMYSQMPMTFGQSMTILKNSFFEWLGALNRADGPLKNITTQVQALTAYLQSSNGQALFNGLASGVAIAVSWLVQLATLASQIYVFIADNWPTIGPIVWGVVAALVAWGVATRVAAAGELLATIRTGILTAAVFAQMLATQGLRAAWTGLNATMKANIFILLISLIAGLIVYLVRLWQTNDQFAAGMMRAWNTILNFFDQVPIFFQKIGNGIVDGFQWAKVTSLKIMEELVNGTIDHLNSLIDTLNKIPGVSLDAVDHVELTAKAAAEAEAIRQAGEDKIERMKAAAADKAAEREKKVLDLLDSRASKRAAKEADKQSASNFSGTSLFSPNGNINKVNEVGKIKNKVDISSEDLKTMRELAEMKNIQNFVTLQPSFSFGDTHVKQESDINTIIDRVTVAMEEHVGASVRGDYG